MPSTLSTIETLARRQLLETTPRFWTSQEITDICALGIRDLWRDIVDLKQEHFFKINQTDVTYPVNSNVLVGVPPDVHKIYLIEPLSLSDSGVNPGLQFMPLEYNHLNFQLARTIDPVAPENTTIYYSITQAGAPVNAPSILCAPQVTSTVQLSFCYCPTLGDLASDDIIPIPGECNNALVAWVVAFCKAKQSDAGIPDTGWLTIYATEKQHLLESLGVRQYQEPVYVDAMFETYWA